jgi:hypothetical protein
MRLVLLDDEGIVTNWVDGEVAAVQAKWPFGAVVASDTARIGQKYDAATGSFIDHTPVIHSTLAIQVSAAQIRKALTAAGVRAAVEAYVAASTDSFLHDEWEYSTTFESDNPRIIAWAQSCGKTQADVDSIFNLAKTL